MSLLYFLACAPNDPAADAFVALFSTDEETASRESHASHAREGGDDDHGHDAEGDEAEEESDDSGYDEDPAYARVEGSLALTGTLYDMDRVVTTGTVCRIEVWDWRNYTHDGYPTIGTTGWIQATNVTCPARGSSIAFTMSVADITMNKVGVFVDIATGTNTAATARGRYTGNDITIHGAVSASPALYAFHPAAAP